MISLANLVGNSTPCSSECKTLTDAEVHAIIDLKEAFDESIKEIRLAFNVIDSDCPNQHYTNIVQRSPLSLL